MGTARIRAEVLGVDWSPRNGATVVVSGLPDGVESVVDTARVSGPGRAGYVVAATSPTERSRE